MGAKASEEVLILLYETAVEPARERLDRGHVLGSALGDADGPTLARFLIFFSAFGVGMTEPVPDWIRRAGERASELGYVDLGRALSAHARHEAGHHELMIRDLRRLTAFYAEKYGPSALCADALLAEPYPPGVLRYRALHEEVIRGKAPFSQIAIEYEIEALSVRAGPRLLSRVGRVLGNDVLASLSFVEEHVALDVGHTRFNRAELARLLSNEPEVSFTLVDAGVSALEAYGAFLDDCWARARGTS